MIHYAMIFKQSDNVNCHVRLIIEKKYTSRYSIKKIWNFMNLPQKFNREKIESSKIYKIEIIIKLFKFNYSNLTMCMATFRFFFT